MEFVSQKTIIKVTQVLRDHGTVASDDEEPVNYFEVLYGNEFPDWFVNQAQNVYGWDWQNILMALRNGAFFAPRSYFSSGNITGEYLTEGRKETLGELFVQRLAAFATTLSGGEPVYRSLQLDGFDVDKVKLCLIPLEGSVSAAQEEDRLTRLVKQSGISNGQTVLKHIEDAHKLYTDGKFHPSLNESRNLLQILIDETSADTDKQGKHSIGFPGGTANRIEYLKKVNFFTNDEELSYKAAWGSLSAGSHPGVPEREQARIGLVLALEFAQLVLLKFQNWRLNGYVKFS